MCCPLPYQHAAGRQPLLGLNARVIALAGEIITHNGLLRVEGLAVRIDYRLGIPFDATLSDVFFEPNSVFSSQLALLAARQHRCGSTTAPPGATASSGALRHAQPPSRIRIPRGPTPDAPMEHPTLPFPPLTHPCDIRWLDQMLHLRDVLTAQLTSCADLAKPEIDAIDSQLKIDLDALSATRIIISEASMTVGICATAGGCVGAALTDGSAMGTAVGIGVGLAVGFDLGLEVGISAYMSEITTLLRTAEIDRQLTRGRQTACENLQRNLFNAEADRVQRERDECLRQNPDPSRDRPSCFAGLSDRV